MTHLTVEVLKNHGLVEHRDSDDPVRIQQQDVELGEHKVDRRGGSGRGGVIEPLTVRQHLLPLTAPIYLSYDFNIYNMHS